MWIINDSELLLEVLEIHAGHLVVVGKGEPFPIRPATTEAVLLSFDEGDQLNMALAAQSMSYDPLTHNLRHLEPVTSYSQVPRAGRVYTRKVKRLSCSWSRYTSVWWEAVLVCGGLTPFSTAQVL